MAIVAMFQVNGADSAIDVYGIQAQLDAFGAKLGPILQEVGIEAKPRIFEVYNIIDGQ